MVFQNGVKNIQAGAYDGARTVFLLVITSPTKTRQNFPQIYYYNKEAAN